MQKRYRKITPVIEAMQYDGDNRDEITKFTRGKANYSDFWERFQLYDSRNIFIGDWVLKFNKDEYLCITDERFRSEYLEVQDG